MCNVWRQRRPAVAGCRISDSGSRLVLRLPALTVAGVLLAAGNSRRMGRAKALLPYRGTTLLDHAADLLVASGCRPRFVVVGPEVEKSCWSRKEQDLEVLVNADSGAGMASSLRAALRAIEASAEVRARGQGLADGDVIDGVLITLADQPLVTAEHLAALLAAGRETGLAATAWAQAFGPPTYLHRAFFPQLNDLEGDEGAKKVLAANRDRLRLVTFPGAAFDIDDPDDYARLLSGEYA
ncbi:MAG: nucleotidyltransferase family protein [Thermoanaerobaculia bacterium]